MLASQPQAPLLRAASHKRSFVLLSQGTVFLSAFLLFLVEPMMARMILPFFGGSAAVWATCLVFYQSALLLGYYYADVSSRRLSARSQKFAHMGMLAAGLFFLPLVPSGAWKPHAGADPVGSILLLLVSVIGLPFALMSATSPLMQSWFRRALPERDPYFLFSLSNLASFLALVSYPLLIEPHVSTGLQGRVWSFLFAAFVLLCAGTVLRGDWSGATAAEAEIKLVRIPLTRSLQWLAFAACGSMLLLTVSNHLTQDIAPVPLLWVLPLALYLLSFTLVFSRSRYYQRWLFVWLFGVALFVMGYGLYDPHRMSAIQVSVPVFCVGLFVCCMFLHGELNRLRPEGSALTAFYLMVSVGGALGAIFVGLIAPRIFNSLYEFPLTLALGALLALGACWCDGWPWRVLWSGLVGLLVYVLISNVQALHDSAIAMTRNFYGALRVTENIDKTRGPVRSLYHGIIRHGTQYMQPPWNKVPVTYYSYQSGIGLALQYCCPGSKRVGVIGLGAGTLATYGKAGDYFHFYDIDPDVVNIANRYFTYLRDSPAGKEITLGDARLSLEAEPPQQFDVLAVDAFSGDAIPVHLLTAQAMKLYLRHLKPNGVLAIHTSNSYLILEGVVQRLADHFGYPAKLIENDPQNDLNVTYSDWMLVSRNDRFMRSSLVLKNEAIPERTSSKRLWTDDDNNLFEILAPIRFFPSKQGE